MKTEFEIGGKVIYIKKDPIWHKDLIIGNEYVVTEANESGIKVGVGLDYWLQKECFMKAKEGKMKFKVGDKVEMIDTGDHYSTYDKMADLLGATKWKPNAKISNGEIGFITNLLNFRGDIFHLVDFGGKEIICGQISIKIIKGAKMEFKVGDKIRVKSKSVGMPAERSTTYKACIKQGFGYVSRIDGDGSGRDDSNCIMIGRNKGDIGGDFASKDLELYEKNSQRRKFKKGDKVICIDNPGSGMRGAGWEKGLIFKINRISGKDSGGLILWPGENADGIFEDSVVLYDESCDY